MLLDCSYRQIKILKANLVLFLVREISLKNQDRVNSATGNRSKFADILRRMSTCTLPKDPK